MVHRILFICSVAAAVFHSTVAYRILVFFPTPSFSHQRPQIAISKALAARGHELVIISPDPFKTDNPNVTQIDCHFLYKTEGEEIQQMAISEVKPSDTVNHFRQVAYDTIDSILSMKEVKEVLCKKCGRKPFDAVIVENLMSTAPLAIGLRFNLPIIGITSLEMMPDAHKAMGNTAHPYLHPSVLYTLPDTMGFLDRVQMLLNHYEWIGIQESFDVLQAKLIQKHFPEVKVYGQELQRQIDFAIEVVSPVFDHVRPILPNTKQIGLVHMEPEPKPLPKDLQTYLDSSKRGVVYVSFGSNVKSVNIGNHMMNILLTVLGSLEYDVLWKYENDTMPNKPKNVRIMKWTPQTDLLAHKNIKLFITQGGFQSIDESVYRGVPLVVIPFFADQRYNAGKAERLRIGKKIFKSDVTVENLKAAIEEVTSNPMYKQRVLELRKRALDTPMPPAETAAWWIEYAIRNKGADHLKYRGRDFPFYQYYFLDMVAAVLVVAGLTVFLLLKIKALLSNGDQRKNKSKKKD